VFKKEVVPQLELAGYNVVVVRLNASKVGIPMNSDRIFVVATLFPRTGLLEERMAAIRSQPVTTLASWFPDLLLVRHNPYKKNRAVFDATTQPHPRMRTDCAVDIDVDFYFPRRGDAGPIKDSVFLSLERRKLVCGLPSGFILPPIDEMCALPCCASKKTRWPLVSSCLGNIVVPEQAIRVLQALEIPQDAWELAGSARTSQH